MLPNHTELLHLPPPHLPLLQHAAAVRRQFLTAEALRVSFVFNMSTHYLSVAPLLREEGIVNLTNKLLGLAGLGR